MAVNLDPPRAEDLLTIAGVRLGVAEAGIRKKGRKDLLVVEIAEGSRVAGVFTRNRYCAAPVTVCRDHLADEARIRAIVVNTGIANAGTGEAGLANARATCAAVGEALGVAGALRAAVFHRRDHGAPADGSPRGRHPGGGRRPARRTAGPKRPRRS